MDMRTDNQAREIKMELTTPKAFEPKSRIDEILPLVEEGLKKAIKGGEYEEEPSITIVIPGIFSKADRVNVCKMYMKAGWAKVSHSVGERETNEVTQFTFYKITKGEEG